MSMKVKAMILVTGFCVILFLPFAVHAIDGNFFKGLPIPEFNDSAAAVNDAAATDEGAADEQYDAAADTDAAAAAYAANCPQSGLNAAQEEYAQSLPKPELDSASVQLSISIDDMRNHMNILKQEGRSTKQCLACHTNREEFCDRCHSYSGVKPTFD